MKIWQLPGFPNCKCRRSTWLSCQYRKPSYHSVDGPDLDADDWELFEEPKVKKEVTLWMPIFKKANGTYFSGVGFESSKEGWRICEGIVGWESRTVEVEE